MNNNAIKPQIDVEKGGREEQVNDTKDTNNTSKSKITSFCERSSNTICLVVIVSASIVVSISIIAIWYYMGYIYGVTSLLVALISILLASGKWRWFYIAGLTAPRDAKALFRYIKIILFMRRLSRSNATIADIFSTHVAKTPEKACLVFEGKEWTFREVNDLSNRIANTFNAHGYKNGDVVALFMENRPEFVCIWLGLSKLGIVVPLINTNLRKQSLLHSITVAKCNAIIYGQSLTDAITEIIDSIPTTLSLYQFNDVEGTPVIDISKDLTTILAKASADYPSGGSVQKANHHDKLLYIYTSGTTGLPKAAVITHSRFVFIVAGIHYVSCFKTEDVFYTPLPLYHTAGGVMSVGQALLFGATVVIRKKFSASQYFVDCQKYKCTIAQYIGEMCRYMLATTPSAADKDHMVRMIFGNGLRPQIWPQFVNRFRIKDVREFYGATEGNANIVNVDNTVGAIGFVSRIIPSVYPISIIRADAITGEPIRGRDGLCQKCGPGEPGVFIGKITSNPSRAFLGYVDKGASDKKVVKDVFAKGDAAFLSGDVLESDERGNLYFRDRTGDTFRWKGENVSTSEVEALVSNVAGYRDTVVYGVEIPNMEGRAGMAAILDTEHSVNLETLGDHIKSSLPSYARPQFIRLLTKVDLTGTFKLKKVDLQKEGYNPSQIEDPIYYLTTKGTYERLTADVFEKIEKSEIRF